MLPFNSQPGIIVPLCTKMENILVFISIILIFGNFHVVFAQNSNEENRYLIFLNDNNSTTIIDLQEKPDMRLLQRTSKQDKNLYLLFTQENQYTPQRLINGNSTSIKSSNFNVNRETVVVVHGWGSDKDADINKVLRDVYMKISDVNFIVVDWSYVGDSNYVTASAGAVEVGRALGRFLAYLKEETGLSYSDVHLVGFSLGAHVVGRAGRFVGSRVARITGLDPAGPLWEQDTNRLQATDGVYVEAIHTNKGVLGIRRTVGDTDFYPNGGQLQPGCFILNPTCSHKRSYQLFASTLQYNRLVGRKCASDYELYNNLCFGEYLNMGNSYLEKTGNGRYRLKTTKTYPYF